MGRSDQPEFLATGHPDGTWTLQFPAQVRAWVRTLVGESPADLLVSFTRADAEKTRRQEKALHAMLAPWARDKGHKIDYLKQMLLAEVFGTYAFQVGTISVTVLAEPSTTKLTKAQYSTLITRSLDIAAEMDDYILIPPDEYRWTQSAPRS